MSLRVSECVWVCVRVCFRVPQEDRPRSHGPRLCLREADLESPRTHLLLRRESLWLRGEGPPVCVPLAANRRTDGEGGEGGSSNPK